MEEGGRRLEDVPELIHHIQLRLPVKEAARTSVLSKSWLHAWSTIPTLRFKNYMNMNVDRTLKRYICDNIPIERFDLDIDIKKHESACVAQNWIWLVATTQTCLKEISLSIRAKGASFMVPNEILSGENLTKIKVSGCFEYYYGYSIRMATHPVIKCVSLRELQLEDVHIREEVLHDILSSCSFLVKISLLRFKGVKTIKVKNRPCLQELTLSSDYPTILEVSHVPNLWLFSSHQSHQRLRFAAHSISLGSSVTQLSMGGVIIDDAFVNMIKSNFPLLESLSLDMSSSKLKRFDFTCASMKRLSLTACRDTLLDVQVYAPKLLFFFFNGRTMPNLLFPATTIFTFKEIKLSLILRYPVDVSLFLKMREALTLSSKCYLRISTLTTIMPIDIDDLRARLRFPPAINMEEMTFESFKDECLWDRSTFFDAFFETCHPKEVFALQDMRFKHNNHFSRLMLKEFLEKKKTTTTALYWRQYLKHVQIRLHQQWETLTDSHTSFLDGSTREPVNFSLEWL